MPTPWSKLRIADGHVHFFSRRFFEALAAPLHKLPREIAETLGWELPPEDSAELARAWAKILDSHGVARAALIASIPGDETSVIAAAQAVPGRFFAYAMVNPLSENASVIAGLNAICLFPAMHGYALHDPRVSALLDRAAAQRTNVFIHCGVLTVGVRKKLGLPSPFDMRFSNPLDLHAIALRYPQLRFIVPHFGAGLFREALMLADLCPNVYLDTSSSNSWMRYEGLDLKAVFRRALDVVGPSRLIFGTDSSFLPRGWNCDILSVQAQALHDLKIADADAAMILGGNLEKICEEI